MPAGDAQLPGPAIDDRPVRGLLALGIAFPLAIAQGQRHQPPRQRAVAHRQIRSRQVGLAQQIPTEHRVGRIHRDARFVDHSREEGTGAGLERPQVAADLRLNHLRLRLLQIWAVAANPPVHQQPRADRAQLLDQPVVQERPQLPRLLAVHLARQALAVADHLLALLCLPSHHQPRAGAIAQRHPALEHDQVIGRPVAAPLDAQQVAGVRRASPADGGEHVQLWRLHNHHRLARGLLQIHQGLVGRRQELAEAVAGGFGHRGTVARGIRAGLAGHAAGPWPQPKPLAGPLVPGGSNGISISAPCSTG